MRISLTASWIVALLALSGCESSTPPTETAMGSTEATAPAPPQPAAPADASKGKDQPPADAAAAEPAAETPEAAAGTGTPAPAEGSGDAGDAVEAKVGAGAKGRDYGGEGFVTTPIETLFRAEELVIFEAHIPKNLELYKAEHDNKGPASHEEFMQVIIKDGGVKLPELPDGEEYWYNAKTEKLMVRHPKPAAQ